MFREGVVTITATEEPGIERRDLRSQATEILRGRILTGLLEPGSLYSIGDMADQLEISITPVREALLQLANLGLVEMVRNRGFRIKQVSDDGLDEIVECRILLEVAAMQRLALDQTQSVADLYELALQTEAAVADGDMVEFLALDRRFHLDLTARAGNSHLLRMVESLRDQTRLYNLNRIAGSGSLAESAKEHQILLKAIESGDVADVERVMRHHLEHARGLWAVRGV